MRRFTVSLSLALVVLIGLIATMGRSTSAQDTSLADHPIVGLWQWENDFGDEVEISYATFHADGTYVEEVFAGITLLGVWQATGARTADLTLFATDADPDPAVTMLGEGRFAIEVGETGDTFDLEGSFQGQNPDGTALFVDEGLLSECTRMEVTTAPFGTPTAATPAA